MRDNQNQMQLTAAARHMPKPSKSADHEPQQAEEPEAAEELPPSTSTAAKTLTFIDVTLSLARFVHRRLLSKETGEFRHEPNP